MTTSSKRLRWLERRLKTLDIARDRARARYERHNAEYQRTAEEYLGLSVRALSKARVQLPS